MITAKTTKNIEFSILRKFQNWNDYRSLKFVWIFSLKFDYLMKILTNFSFVFGTNWLFEDFLCLGCLIMLCRRNAVDYVFFSLLCLLLTYMHAGVYCKFACDFFIPCAVRPGKSIQNDYDPSFPLVFSLFLVSNRLATWQNKGVNCIKFA